MDYTALYIVNYTVCDTASAECHDMSDGVTCPYNVPLAKLWTFIFLISPKLSVEQFSSVFDPFPSKLPADDSNL